MSATRTDGDPRRAGLWLLAILLLAAVTRFCGLDYHSLRNDELSSWTRSNYASIDDVIAYGVVPDPHPPGHQLMLWFIQTNLGDSAPIMRAPAAIAGLLAVIVIYLIGRDLFGRREGLTAAALMALSAAAIYYSQDSRAYSLLILCVTLSSWCLWPIVRTMGEDGRLPYGPIAGFILVGAAASYLHYFGLVMFATQAAYLGGVALLGRRWKHVALTAFCVASVALLYAPWWGGFYDDLTARAAPDWMVRPGRKFPGRYLDAALNSTWLLSATFVILLAALFVAEVKRVAKSGRLVLFDETRTPVFFVAYWLFAPFTIAVVRSYISEPVATIRNLMILLPAVYLLMARGLSMLPRRTRIRSGATAIVVALMAYGLFFDIRYYTTPQKHQFREAAQYVIVREKDYPDAPVYAMAFQKAYFDYYFERLGASSRVAELVGETADIERMGQILDTESPENFWYLTGTREPDAEFLAFLGGRYELVDEALFLGASARLYRQFGTDRD